MEYNNPWTLSFQWSLFDGTGAKIPINFRLRSMMNHTITSGFYRGEVVGTSEPQTFSQMMAKHGDLPW